MQPTPRYDRRTHWLAGAALLSAVPLVMFGGWVTTLGAGMAVEGWWIAEGHFLLFFPVDVWMRDLGTFVEHTHRLFGMLVGTAALAAALFAWIHVRGRGAWLASLALLAVMLQGAVGGFRVLEESSALAFLHGVFAQATFALLGASALVLSARWRDAAAAPAVEGAPRLRWVAVGATAIVFAQVFVGAWYRHGLRPEPDAETPMRLMLHAGGAAAVFFALGFLVSELKAAAARTEGLGAAALRREARRLHVLLGLQLLLGVLAWMGFRPGAVGPLEWAISVLHVLGGALLLTECLLAALWAGRLAAPARAAALATLGGTR